ncbi:MAG: oligosaccharide flippase family protein [Methanothermobacter tenebrarum]|uniref:Flippase n=2 Tax=Methanothermobacter tenebrarum TaxID=680118 RepID=A0A328P8H1_9EURY|nr:oligosaccharide flippase family protein [Methanobacteriaceae archaeon]RAO78688.1 flippase [Methanothermobacter tenebrarum]
MISRLKLILSNKDYRRILDNLMSLTGIQLVQYLLPLVTFPYLTRVLGPANFGRVAFAVAFIGYFQILTDYGFNLSATREISINRDDLSQVSKIYSSVMVTKTILMFLTFILMLVIISSFERFRGDPLLYIFTFGLVVGSVLFPVWFFQGIERMRYISILRILSSLIYTALIFIIVRGPKDYLYVPLVNSIGFIVVGVYSQHIVRKEFKVKFLRPKLQDIKKQLVEGWHLFISTLAISLYTTSNRFILGLLVDNATLGYYAVAEDITRALQGLVSPIGQAIYPYFSRIQAEDRERAKTELKKILILISVLTFIFSIILVFLAPFIVMILAGPSYKESILLLQILIFIVFLVGVSNVLGIQGLVSFGYKEKFTRILITAGIIHIIMLIILTLILSTIGAAIAVVITELIVCILMYDTLKKLKIF